MRSALVEVLATDEIETTATVAIGTAVTGVLGPLNLLRLPRLLFQHPWHFCCARSC